MAGKLMRQKPEETMNERRTQQIVEIAERFKPGIGARKDFRTLDVGCGGKLLAKYIYNYWGCDFKDYGLCIHPKRFKGINLNTTPRLPYPSNCFDVVVCADALEHLLFPFRIMKELKRVAKPNGIIIISLPNEITLDNRIRCLFGRYPGKINYMSHHWFFTMPEAEKFLIKRMGQPVHKDYFFACSGGRWMRESWRRWLARKFPRWFAGSVIMVFRK